MDSENEFSNLLKNQLHIKIILKSLCEGYDIEQILQKFGVRYTPELIRDARHAILELVRGKPTSKYYLTTLGQEITLGKFWEGVDLNDLSLDKFTISLLKQFLENKGVFSDSKKDIMKKIIRIGVI